MRLFFENWFSYERLDWSSAVPITVFGGYEGVGKTAIRDGIEFVFLGTCRGISTKKVLGRIAVREGTTDARCAVQVPGVIQVVRTLDTAGRQEVVVVDLREGGQRYEGKITDVEPRIFEILGIEPRQVRAVLNAWAFLDMSEADRRELLFSTDSSDVSSEKVVEAFGVLGVSGPEAESILAVVTTSGFREAEKKAGANRASAKRDRDDLDEPACQRWFHHPGDSPDKRVDLESKTIGALEDFVKLKRESHENILRSSGENAGALRAEVRAVESRLQSKRDELADLAGDERSLDELNGAVAAARESKAETEEAAGAARAELESIERQIGALPTTVDPDALAEIDGVSKTSLRVVRAHHEKGNARAGELAEMLSRAQAKLQDRTFHANAAAEALTELEGLVETKAGQDERERALRADIQSLTSDLENKRSALADAGRAPQNDPSVFSRAQLDRAEAVLKAKKAYEDDKGDLEAYRQELAAVEKRIQAWDAVAQALKPSGVESILLRAKLETIRAHLAHVRKLGVVTISDDLVLELQIGDRMRVEPKLSRGQKMRLGIAMQHVVCALTGFPFLVVDEFDTLDPFKKDDFLAAVMEISPVYDAILVLTTLQKPLVAPPIQGVQAFEIRDGGLVSPPEAPA